MMENTPEFEKWLSETIRAGEEKLGMTDETLAYILLREATAHYLKTLGRCGRCPNKPQKIWD